MKYVLLTLMLGLLAAACVPADNGNEYENKDESIDLENCLKYYDGCNECQVVDGDIVACTERACVQYDEPRCLEREAPDHKIDLLPTQCEENGGLWNDTHKECTQIDEDTCNDLGGQLLCLSPCRHDPDAEVCIASCDMVCVAS